MYTGVKECCCLFSVLHDYSLFHVLSGEALEGFLKRNNLSHVIRAHEVKATGFQVCVCVSLFGMYVYTVCVCICVGMYMPTACTYITTAYSIMYLLSVSISIYMIILYI